jgi:hypothetical protein
MANSSLGNPERLGDLRPALPLEGVAEQSFALRFG